MASPIVTGNVPVPDPAPKPSAGQKLKNILEHALEFFEVGVKDIAKYGPEAEVLAAAWIPGFKGMSKENVDKAVAAAALVNNTVVAVQQKYSDAEPGEDTNEDKLADALSIAGPAAVSLLQSAGVKQADTDFVSNGVKATVAILNNYTVPASA